MKIICDEDCMLRKGAAFNFSNITTITNRKASKRLLTNHTHTSYPDVTISVLTLHFVSTKE